MPTKFTDRLKRLHESRVRALEGEEPDQPRVFVADASVETDVARAPAPPPVTPTPTSATASVPTLDDARRAQLERQQRLAARSKPRKLVMQPQKTPSTAPAQPAPSTNWAPRSDNAIGQRLGDLRIQAAALIDAGRHESALALLHEMVSLSPSNPYPLAELARIYRAAGQHEFAELYEGRLRAVAPY